MTQILLIEDRKKLSHDLSIVLEFLGEQPVSVTRAYWLEQGTGQPISAEGFKLALIGHYKPALMLPLLEELVARHGGLPIVLLGDQPQPILSKHLKSAVVATLPMPLSYQPVLDALHKAQVHAEHYQRLRDIGNVRDYNMFRNLVGDSAAVQGIRQLMSQVAHTEVTVLITGESGTGKEVVARNLHANSERAGKPFVPINCGAIPPELLESELFGHEKGAFTGAISTRTGRFELAQGGTLFLDEIGDMPLPMQVKLLRVLQEQCFERVGGTRTLQTDVRILAATHRNLEDMIDAGTFRQDLYYRLNVFPIEMPSLRERAEDIPFLLNELITRLENAKRGSVRFNSAAIRALTHYPWPGNVRELANLVERMAIMHPHAVVGVQDLPSQYSAHASVVPSLEVVKAGSVRDSVRAEALGNADAMQLNEQRLRVGEQSVRSRTASTVVLGEVTRPGAATAGAEVADSGAAEFDAQTSSLAGMDPAHQLLPVNGLDLREYLANLEKNLIEQALNDSGGVVARAADRLGIRRTTLVEKMRKYDMQR